MTQPTFNRVFNVLFLCTANSARSIMSEGLLNILGHGRFNAYSAGTHPSGEINRYTIELLQSIGYDTSHLHSKSWQEFEGRNAPHMDIVITVCDDARGEVCPSWPGHPISAHWAYEDPSGETEEEKHASYCKIFAQIKRRIDLLVSLPSEKLEHLTLNNLVQEIGQTPLN
ncbi:arsenate reductase ArsC [Iodobacter sp. LRB]|uniref:arsenate reductase ArsC n=1 Tax=unclassified Iodobacter TaxID=235634 RepID=UPI000C12155A|nr:arsenate reductase ArsC [Iodobacter sp. BJB302]PHV03597.1 protein-tyrosine-phosphatase [Iodobacter sp. BJB302]